MKTNKLVVFLLVALLLSVRTSAQKSVVDPKNPKYNFVGATRTECLKNISLYSELVKQENYKEAKKTWAKVFAICPKASQNTFINGVKIYTNLIERETDPLVRASYLDTLMMIYDKQIQHFGHKGYVLGRKALDLVNFAPDSLMAAYKMFNESIELQKRESEDVVISKRYQVGILLYNKQQVSEAELVKMYIQSTDYLDIKLAAKPEDKATVEAKEKVEYIFATSGIATCENLITIFAPRFKAKPDNIEQIKKIARLLGNANCGDQLFFDVSEAIYQKEPSTELAYNLAQMFESKGENTNALAYYKEAIKKQTDGKEESKYYLDISNLYNKLNNKPAAREAAYKAIAADSTSGMAYIVLGDIYAGVINCGETDFARQSIYWLVVDKYAKAKQIDSSIAEKANKLIAKYSQYFPKKEDIFFQGLATGQNVYIGCWINETTYVR